MEALLININVRELALLLLGAFYIAATHTNLCSGSFKGLKWHKLQVCNRDNMVTDSEQHRSNRIHSISLYCELVVQSMCYCRALNFKIRTGRKLQRGTLDIRNGILLDLAIDALRGQTTTSP